MVITAQSQTNLAPADTLNSTTAGVVVEVTAQLKNGYRKEALRLLRDASLHVNEVKKGKVTVLSFHEVGTFGRLHVMLNLSSMNDYDDLRSMASIDGAFARMLGEHSVSSGAGGSWDAMFVDGSIKATVMLPQFRRMYGADDKAVEFKSNQPLRGLPPAFNQFTLPLEEIIHSANAGLMIHRSAQLKYGFRSEGRVFAREVVDSINTKGRGEATCFLYEEAFGSADRLHWLIHMKTVGSYYPLIQMHAADPEVRELYFRETLPAEKGGGNWSRMFVEGSMVDCAFAPISL